MISFRHRFLFVHIPKTGGNSIQAALAPYADDRLHFRPSVGRVRNEDGTQGLDVFNERLGFDQPEHKHATVEEYRRRLGDEFESFFVFTAVRNPFDRVISQTAFTRGVGSAEIALDALTLPPLQVNYMRLDGRVAITNLIRFESLQRDFDRVCERIGIPRAVLPHKNASVRAEYARYYTVESRAAVASFYAADIEALGYQF